MNRTIGNINNDINKVKNHIQRVFPFISKIDVKIQKLPNKKFKSFIRVLAPQRKEFVAHKVDHNPKKSIEKSQMAIMRQVGRIKTKRDGNWRRFDSLTS